MFHMMALLLEKVVFLVKLFFHIDFPFRSSDDLAQKNETTEKTFPISLVTYEPGQNRNSGMLNQIRTLC